MVKGKQMINTYVYWVKTSFDTKSFPINWQITHDYNSEARQNGDFCRGRIPAMATFLRPLDRHLAIYCYKPQVIYYLSVNWERFSIETSNDSIHICVNHLISLHLPTPYSVAMNIAFKKSAILDGGQVSHLKLCFWFAEITLTCHASSL